MQGNRPRKNTPPRRPRRHAQALRILVIVAGGFYLGIAANAGAAVRSGGDRAPYLLSLGAQYLPVAPRDRAKDLLLPDPDDGDEAPAAASAEADEPPEMTATADAEAETSPPAPPLPAPPLSAPSIPGPPLALPPAAPVSAPAPAQPARLSPAEQQMVDLHNAERARSGLPPLAVDPGLMAVARQRANEMAVSGNFSHTSGTGQTAFTLIAAAGITAPYAGENIAFNTYDEGQSIGVAMNGFNASPSHHANIVEPHYTRIGVGVAVSAAGGRYYAVIFAGP